MGKWSGLFVYVIFVLACAEEEEKIGPSQGLSEACDPELGIDACGAGLFCEAFDGREHHTCYALGTRLPGEECSDNAHCGNGRCVDGVCGKALVKEPCETDDDCEEGLKCAAVCYQPGFATGTGTGTTSTSTGTGTGTSF